VQPDRPAAGVLLRNPAILWGLGALSAAVLVASTLELGAFQRSLGLRAAVMAIGLLPAALLLYRLVPAGTVDHTNRRRLLFAIIAVHVIATFYFFPLLDVLNDRPVVTLDHSFHYYQVFRAKEVFWDTLRFDRYDPYFMAGYPGGTIFDLDVKGAEAFCAVVPFVDAARALKLFILCAYISMVPSIYWGSRMQGFKIEESVFGLLVFLAWWHWGRPYAGDFRYAGMFSFVFATHLCFLLVGLLRRALRGHMTKTFIGLGPVAFLIHPTSVVMLPVPFAVAIGADRRHLTRRKWFVFAAWCIAIVFINAVWLEPFFRYLWMKTTTEAYYQIEGWRGLARVLVKPTCTIALAMIALGVVGTVAMAAQRRLSKGLPAAVGAAFLFGLAGAGVYLPGINQLEPGRFLFAAFVFLAPLAGVGTRLVVDAALAVVRGDRLRRRLRATVIVTLAISVLPLSLLESKSFYKHTVRTTLPPAVASLVEAISSRIESPGRLMIEDCEAMHYGDVHLPALLPLRTGVEQIGGPYPHTFLLYYFTSFRWEETFGRPMDHWTLESLRPYLDLYDVRWVLTATTRSTRLMSDLLGRPPAWSQPPYAFWGVEGDRGPAAPGRPVIEASINRLEVSCDAGSAGYVLDYHWVPGLRSSGAAHISPVHRLDDLVPFIFVEPNGESTISITY
jgi:hypothetical protein